MTFPEYDILPPTQIESVAESVPENGTLRFVTAGENIDGRKVEKTVLLPLGPKPPDMTGTDRLMAAGLELAVNEGTVLLDNVVFGSAAQKAGLDFDWEIQRIERPADRWPKQLMFIPALLLLAFVGWQQKRRQGAV